MAKADPATLKGDSESIIRRAGGEVCDWLPPLAADLTPRRQDAVVRRALILNAMFQIYMRAPIAVIRDWITRNGLSDHLSAWERQILKKKDGSLTDPERTRLYWYVEALWALTWVGSLIDDLPFNEPVADTLASLCPNLQQDEDGSKFSKSMRLRPPVELLRMLDLYYRLHWWTRNAHLTGQDTGDVRLDFIMERRRALEWVMDPDRDWDDVDLST